MGKMVYFYNAPIELYQRFLDTPLVCLRDVLDYQILKYDNIEIASDVLGVKWGNVDKSIANSETLHGRSHLYSGVQFSIPREDYWEYHDNVNVKDEYDFLAELAYLALKTMVGRNKMWSGTNATMFMRMAGYGKKATFVNHRCNIGRIGNYMKSDRTIAYHGERLRMEVMARHPAFHCYSQKGRRGFVFMFDNDLTHEEAFPQLCEYMNSRSRIQRNNNFREQMYAARESMSQL